jgi:hypothetical protein
LNNQDITIGSVYCTPALSINQFESDIDKLLSLPGSVLLAGDFNSKHADWNNTNYCRKGTLLKRKCERQLFEIHAPTNSPTLFPSRGKPSTVDFILSKNIHGIQDVLAVNDLSSDHLPVKCTVNPQKFQLNDNLYFDFAKANFKTFKSEVSASINTPVVRNNCISNKQEKDSLLENFNEIILTASDNNIPRKLPYYFRYPSSDKIALLSKNRNHFRNLYNRTLNPAFKSMVNQLNRLIKKETFKLNQTKFEESLQSLKIQDNSLHTFTKVIKTKKISIPPLKKPNDEFTQKKKRQVFWQELF